jgi:hypothetical protein
MQTEVTLHVKIDPAREEALALADKYVTDWTEQTKNQRGYVHDQWTPVEVMTRTEAVLKVADWLLTRPSLLSPPPPGFVPRETGGHIDTLFGWHPGMGVPSKNTYNMAIWRRDRINQENLPVQAREAEMLRQVIEMYEEVNNAWRVDRKTPDPQEEMSPGTHSSQG